MNSYINPGLLTMHTYEFSKESLYTFNAERAFTSDLIAVLTNSWIVHLKIQIRLEPKVLILIGLRIRIWV